MSYFSCACLSSVAVPSVQGGVESGVDATEPYSSGRRKTSRINVLANRKQKTVRHKNRLLLLLQCILQSHFTVSMILSTLSTRRARM